MKARCPLVALLILVFGSVHPLFAEGGTVTPFGERRGGTAATPTPSPTPPVHPDHVSVISAIYGSGTHFADVTARVNECFANPKGACWAARDSLKTDPTLGWNKCLVIVYDLDGAHHLFTMGEWGKVSPQKMIEALAK